MRQALGDCALLGWLWDKGSQRADSLVAPELLVLQPKEGISNKEVHLVLDCAQYSKENKPGPVRDSEEGTPRGMPGKFTLQK